MKKGFRNITAFFMAFLLVFLSMIPSAVIINAAPLPLAITISFNAQTGLYDISYPASSEPAKTYLSWHNPDGTFYEEMLTDFDYNAGKVTIGVEFPPDHIYDITVKAYTNIIDIDAYAEGSTYYLSKITFEGESFNIMAKMSDIEDKDPEFEPPLDPPDPSKTVLVKSGNNAKMRLKWKIPTIYHNAEIVSLTSLDNNGFLSDLSNPDAVINKVGFQINMRKGKGSVTTLTFNTDYFDDGVAPDDDDIMIIEGTTTQVEGIVNGNVDPVDDYVSVELDKNHGIEPGTEYEYTNIGLIFENNASEQIPLRRTKLKTDSENHFMVRNIDNAFSDYGANLTSVFTPMQFEISKVDVDKVEVRFRRITNGIYPELFYQVQYAPRIDDLYSTTNNWVKIPNTTIPSTELYGSEIVSVNIPGTTHPEYYFRVVYYDSSTNLPKSSSLCVDLRLLGTESGKPPLPREIKVETLYSGRKTVTIPTTGEGSGDVEIPASDLRISFEKPLNWKMIPDWEVYKNQDDYLEDDYAFHILLSTYLPEADPDPETKSIGLSEEKTIYMPVKQKRVLVIGKKDLIQDEDPNRLYCELPGDILFYDYTNTADHSIDFENNEDPSEDGDAGDYPTFLVPNTTYYMQIFTSRFRDIGGAGGINSDVWGDGVVSSDIREKISYLSPAISFTTWPLNELPVPIPNLQLSADTSVDQATGDMLLEGIEVSYQRILTETDWHRYTSIMDNREIRYEIYMSRNAADGFQLVATDTAPYPDEAEIINRPPVSIATDDTGQPIKSNTIYYFKAQASLVVGGDVIGRSVFTPVKVITTPQIDSGSLDNSTRDPRSPSEFAIALDSEGEPLLSDAWVELGWLHAEKDVDYEMICTSTEITPMALEAEYAADTTNLAFLTAYNEYRSPAGDLKIHVDVTDPGLPAGFSYDEETGKTLMPIRRSFLRANQTYFFSLRAIRNRGLATQTVSRWITIPVTTKMVAAPAYIEAVRDLEVGFNVFCSINGSTADSMEIHMKKTGAPDIAYVKLLRSQYSVVKDGSTYYFRIYNLEPNQGYDFRLYNKVGNSWYSNSSSAWLASPGTPVYGKTRDTLKEIEVRWEGESPYVYALEARAETDTEYEKLIYHSSGFSDYGYDLPSGGRIEFYREKTNIHVEEKLSSKYIYYAKIKGKPVRKANGSLEDLPLKTNTLYSIKLWAINSMDESLHIGPVSVRTDFSQEDYDDQKTKDNVVDVYNLEAEKLTQKLYWIIDKGKDSTVRALIKGDMVSGLVMASQGSTVSMDFSAENQNPQAYEIIVPQKVLEAIETYDACLNLILQGAEVTLNRGSIDLAGLKQQAMTNGAAEAMLKLRVERNANVKTALPSGFKALSKAYALNAWAVGSKYTYSKLNTMIYEILEESDTVGPFQYGLFEKELSKVMYQLDNYSYRSHTELKDMIAGIINTVELNLSRYLKDIIDGGSGIGAALVTQKAISDFPNRIGVKISYQYQTGLVTPFVNYGSGWKEPTGSKAYVMQYALFRAEKPGEYAIVSSGSVTIAPGTSYDYVFEKLGRKYDLSKVFGKGTIIPSNPITGQQAVMLYAVVAERDDEITGLTPAQRTSKLGIGDVVSAKQLTGFMDNQSSVSLAVKLYCEKAGIPVSMLKPTKTILISNASSINSRLYNYVVLGIDLGFAKTSNKMFDAAGRSTSGQVLDMVSKVLEKLGQ